MPTRPARVVLPLVVAVAVALGGCGQRLVDGAYLGDATTRLDGVMQALVAAPSRALVGAAWLGYSGLTAPRRGLEASVDRITSFEFPPRFTFDVLDPPPSTGPYATPDDVIVPAEIRLARLFVFDDVDGDGSFAVSDDGALVAPDQLLAVASSHLLLFVQEPPRDAAALDGTILANWEAASFGYHVIIVDPTVTPPTLSGRVAVDPTEIVFTQPASSTLF
jgi:hypothetical protein